MNGSKGGLLALFCGLLLAAGFLMPSGAAPAAGDFRPMSAPAKPIRLVVPAVGIRATVLPVRVDAANVLDPPSDPTEVGWWQRSARAGATQGQTVLTGHTVHTGGGVMNRLGQLRPGDLVKVGTAHGVMVYRTTSVLTLTKAQLAARSAQLFGQDRASNRLVLITCTGWTGHDYTSNTVVFAQPLGVRVVKPASPKTASAAG